MYPVVNVPYYEAGLALWYINKYWGFKYPSAINSLLTVSCLQKSGFQIAQTIEERTIHSLLEDAKVIIAKDSNLDFLFRVLWLNACLNGNHQTFLGPMDVAQGKYTGRGHYADILRLYNLANTSSPNQPVRISIGDSETVTLGNNDNWFTEYCRGLVGFVPPDFDGEAELKRVTHIKTSTKQNEEKWGVMYSTYRFLAEEEFITQRSEPFWAFMFGYLNLMGLEDRKYSKYDVKIRKTPNSKISTFNSYLRTGKVNVIPRYETIPLMNTPLEFWMSLIYK